MTPPYTQEWLCQNIVQQTQIAVIFSDRQGVIQLWNSGAEAMFGYTAEESIGQSLDIIVPERQRARHWEGYDKVMTSGASKYGREMLAVPATRKDGTRISIEFTIVLVRSPSGDVLGAAAIMQDVTARWQQQKQLRERLAALEAKEQRVGNSG